jgi:hypothetical protein
MDGVVDVAVGIGDRVPRAMLGRAQSLLMVAGGITMFLVLRLTPALLAMGEWVPFAFGSLLLGLSTVAAWFIKEPPIANPATGPFKPWSALQVGLKDRRIIWLMLGVAMIASFESIFTSWTWIWAKTRLGLERGDIYSALSWAQLVSLALAFPTGWLIDKVGGFKLVVLYYVLMLLNLGLLLQVAGKPVHVSKDTATERASVCAKCDQNLPIASCFGCGELGSLYSELVGSLETRLDPALNSCGSCGCNLRLKVHLSDDVLRAIAAQNKETPDSYPAWCWMRKIL